MNKKEPPSFLFPSLKVLSFCVRSRGIHHHGEMLLSNGWFQGELFNQEAEISLGISLQPGRVR